MRLRQGRPVTSRCDRLFAHVTPLLGHIAALALARPPAPLNSGPPSSGEPQATRTLTGNQVGSAPGMGLSAGCVRYRSAPPPDQLPSRAEPTWPRCKHASLVIPDEGGQMLERGGWAGQGQRSDMPEERSDMGQGTIRTAVHPVTPIRLWDDGPVWVL